MPDILIRGIDAKTLKNLKARAKRNGRSLQGEAKLLLEQAGGEPSPTNAEIIEYWRKLFAGRRFSSSVDMIREDRER